MSATTLPKPGPIAKRAIAGAIANLGVREESPNRGRYVEVYQHAAGIGPGDPWCMAWVFYRLWAAAGRPNGYALPQGFPRTGYCPDAAAWAVKHGMWIPAPCASGRIAAGDLVLYWFESLGRVAHTGIVVGCDSHWVQTVEGNTNASGGRDGDGVHRRSHELAAMNPRSGFVRIPF